MYSNNIKATVINIKNSIHLLFKHATFHILKQAEGAEVHIHGSNWNEANEEAQKYLQNAKNAFFVHPFNQPTSWEGHSTIIDEIKQQLSGNFKVTQQPAAIVTVAGGGGLAIGVYKT